MQNCGHDKDAGVHCRLCMHNFLLHTGIGVAKTSLSILQYLMLMNVMKVPLDVIRHVQTHCLAMSAPATQAISWPVMNMDVMVSIHA